MKKIIKIVMGFLMIVNVSLTAQNKSQEATHHLGEDNHKHRKNKVAIFTEFTHDVSYAFYEHESHEESTGN